MGVFSLVIVILHRNDTVFKAAETAADDRRGLPELDSVLTVNAALYDVAVCGEVLNTVRDESGQQLVAELYAAVLRAGVSRLVQRRALFAAEVEEHELAVLRHGEGHRSICRAAGKVGFVVLNQIVGVFIGDAHRGRAVRLHGERIVACRQGNRTAELTLRAKGVRAGDIQRRNQVDNSDHSNRCDQTDEQFSLVGKARDKLLAHKNLQHARCGAADDQHDHRQERAGHIITEALDRNCADDQRNDCRLNEQQKQIHALFCRTQYQHRKARHDKHAERTHREREQIGDCVDHQQDGAQDLLAAARRRDDEPDRQQARDRHQAGVGIRVAENGVQTGVKVAAGVAVACANCLHDDAHRAHQQIAGGGVDGQQTDRSRRGSDRGRGSAEGGPAVIRKQNDAQIDRKSRKKDRKFCDRELARARIQRGYARQQHVRKQRKRRRRQQTLYLVLACKQHHEQRTDRAEHADHLLREIAAVIVEAGDDPQRNRRHGVQSPTGAARRGGLCLNASLRLSVFGLSRFLFHQFSSSDAARPVFPVSAS